MVVVLFILFSKCFLLFLVYVLCGFLEPRQDGVDVMVEVEEFVKIDIIPGSDRPSLINAFLSHLKLAEFLELVVVTTKSVGEPVN